MHVVIAGASGTIGSHLVPYLESIGLQVTKYNRAHPQSLEGVDVVINLAGSPVVEWKKAKILKSRIETTKQLVEAMKVCKNPPKLFISSSATGFYGNSGDQVVDERSPKGTGFLADVCAAWEDEAMRYKEGRVVLLRISMVLTKNAGALAKMLLPFKLCMGAVLGSGNQWMSWIVLEDLLRAIHFIIEHQHISGPVVAASPYPVTNREWSMALAKSLHRPLFFRAPAWLLRLLLGDFADELLLSSTRAHPTKLLDSGFHFHFAKVEDAF